MEELEEYRCRIDALDEEIVALLARRFEIVRAVGELKARQDIKVVQSGRARQVLDRVSALALDKGVDVDLVRGFYTAMIECAHGIERDIKEQSGKAQA